MEIKWREGQTNAAACVAEAIKGKKKKNRQNIAVSRGEAPLPADKSIVLIGPLVSSLPFVAAVLLACVIFPVFFFSLVFSNPPPLIPL